MKLNELESVIEALLFAAGEPVPMSVLSQATEQDERTLRSHISNLCDKYESESRGLQIIEINGTYQMRTHPNYYKFVHAMLKTPQKRNMTQTLLETLAIIAYKQPVTKPQIEEIRGVNADHSVSRLVEYGLVCEIGRLEAPGKPILFGTTNDFLRHYGFENIEKLPELPQETEQLRLEAQMEIN